MPLASNFPELPGSWGRIVLGTGSKPASLAIVGEAPGLEEERIGEPFVGPSGKLLRGLLAEAGLDGATRLYVTNVVKRRPLESNGETRTPTRREAEAWAPSLLEELQEVKPELVLLLGNVALQAVHPGSRTITKVRGLVREHPGGYTTLATLHPAAVLRRSEHRPVVAGDIKLAAKVLKGESVSRAREHFVIRTVEDLRSLKDLLFSAPEFAFDLETRSFDWQTEPILTIAFSTSPGEAYVVPLLGQHCKELWTPEDKQAVLSLLREIMVSPIPKGGQNCGFDVKFLEHAGIPVAGIAFDTLVEHHLLDENLPHNLEFLASYELGESGHDEELRSILTSRTMTFDLAPEPVLWRYTACDVDYTISLHQKFTQKLQLENPKVYEWYRKVLIPLLRTLSRMEMRGVAIDKNWLEKTATEYAAEIARLHQEITKEAGEEINLNSVKQLRELLFEKRGLIPPKLTPRGSASTDDEALKILASQDKIAAKVSEYRTRVKWQSTFIEGLVERLGSDGLLHPSYLLTGTATGRLACRSPNLQNIPDDPRMRGIFCAPAGYVFVAADYAQIELLVMAALSGEATIIDLYNSGKDLHRLLAAEIFRMPADQVTKEIRNAVKYIVFGMNYGRRAWSIAKQLGVSSQEAQALIEQYFETFPRIKLYIERARERALQDGFVEGPFGRRRHLPALLEKNTDETIRAELLRQAINSPIQGTAAEITNWATVRLYQAYDEKEIYAFPVMTMHDALYFYAPVSTWKEDVVGIKRIMEMPVPELGVAPRVTLEVGTRWGDCSLLEKEASPG